MDKASEAILALKPVTFRYKPQLDPDAIPQFGLVAEQVEKVNPNLVARDENGNAYTVRYEAVNAMLLNEFLKEHRRVEEQQRTITDLKGTVEKQQKQIKALSKGLQQVSAAVEQKKAQAIQLASHH
jgi:predicted RNase H-like nuclease (RuvC/YqgF family)